MSVTVLLLRPYGAAVNGGSGLSFYMDPDLDNAAAAGTVAVLVYGNTTAQNQTIIDAASNAAGLPNGTFVLGGESGSLSPSGGWTITCEGPLAGKWVGPYFAVSAADATSGVSPSATYTPGGVQAAAGPAASFAFTNGVSAKSPSGGTYETDNSGATAYNAPPGAGNAYTGTSGAPASSPLLLTATVTGIGSALTAGSGGSGTYNFSGLTMSGFSGLITDANTVAGSAGTASQFGVAFTNGANEYITAGTWAADGATGIIFTASFTSANWSTVPSNPYSPFGSNEGGGPLVFVANAAGVASALTDEEGGGGGAGTMDFSGLIGTDGVNPWAGTITVTQTVAGTNPVNQVRTLALPIGMVGGTWLLNGQSLNYDALVSDVEGACMAAFGADVIIVTGTDATGPYVLTWQSGGANDVVIDSTGLQFAWDGSVSASFTAFMPQIDELNATGSAGSFTVQTGYGLTSALKFGPWLAGDGSDLASAVQSALQTVLVANGVVDYADCTVALSGAWSPTSWTLEITLPASEGAQSWSVSSSITDGIVMLETVQTAGGPSGGSMFQSPIFGDMETIS